MTVAKLAISLHPDLADAIRKAAAEEGESVSGWVAGAVVARLQHEKLGKWLDDFEQDHGAPTAEQMAAAERAWPA